MPPVPAPSSLAARPALSPLPAVFAGVAVIALLAFANAYGFHRDELYFIVAGRHPDLGYVDQGPLTPILSALGVLLFGAVPIAVRIIPALAFGGCILLAAAMAREMGGGSRAQLVAAVCVGLSGLLLAGHLSSTATYDILAAAIASWLIVRSLAGADPRLWLAVGVVIGVALLNKWTIALVPAGLVVGLVIDRRWAVVRSPWPWAAALIALAIWAPNLAWQATHDFPQLEMARRIAADSGSENRAQLVPLQLLLAGPLLWPVLLIGLARLLVASPARPWRPFAWAYLVAFALTWWQQGKAYYLFGFFPVLFAAGSIAVGAWLERGRQTLRLAAFATVAFLSGAIMIVVTLPILPPAALASSGVADVNKESAEQIGWPELTATVEGVVAALPTADRQHASIITANYGEAAALAVFGRDLPPVYSGHNSYWDFGRPADDTSTVILVGDLPRVGSGDCRRAATIDNPAGVPNQERGAPVIVCQVHALPWATLWSTYRHLD